MDELNKKYHRFCFVGPAEFLRVVMEYLLVIAALIVGGAIGVWISSRRFAGKLGENRREMEKVRIDLAKAEAEKKLMREGAQREQDLLAGQREEMRREQEHLWQTRLELLKEEFKSLSDRIFEEKSGKLQNANKEQLESLLNPLREKMTEFKTAVEESKIKGIELNTELNARLTRMMEETVRIGGEAKNLADALKGGQKTQGDWGEMILEDILKRSGLKPGIHYESQETLRDDDGRSMLNPESRRLRPDVVVHYPDGKDVIIDSKVSLIAYLEYMNSPDEETRRMALARHIRSIRSHIDELAKKNYAAHLNRSGRETVDFVIMFIPNEGPYQLAMISEPALWTEAFKLKVMPVSPSNLIALLQLIHTAWTREDQSRNQREILDTAAQMLERIYAFYEQFDEVGRALEKTIDVYGAAVRRLKQGERNRSVVHAGEKLLKLGVKMTKERRIPVRLRPEEETVEQESDVGNQ